MKFKHPLIENLFIERDDSETEDYLNAGWLAVEPEKTPEAEPKTKTSKPTKAKTVKASTTSPATDED